jgi:hypothetical protein
MLAAAINLRVAGWLGGWLAGRLAAWQQAAEMDMFAGHVLHGECGWSNAEVRCKL